MIRDQKSKALINDDVTSLNKYKMERDRVRKMENLSREVIEMKKILSELSEKIEKIESR